MLSPCSHGRRIWTTTADDLLRLWRGRGNAGGQTVSVQRGGLLYRLKQALSPTLLRRRDDVDENDSDNDLFEFGSEAEWELKFAGGRITKAAQEKFDYDPFGYGGVERRPTGFDAYVNQKLREQKHTLFHESERYAEAYRCRDHDRARRERFVRQAAPKTPSLDDLHRLSNWYRNHPSRPGHTRIDLTERARSRRVNE